MNKKGCLRKKIGAGLSSVGDEEGELGNVDI